MLPMGLPEEAHGWHTRVIRNGRHRLAGAVRRVTLSGARGGDPDAEVDHRSLLSRDREAGLSHIQQTKSLLKLDGDKVLSKEITLMRFARVVPQFHRAVVTVVGTSSDDLVELLQIGLLVPQQVA